MLSAHIYIEPTPLTPLPDVPDNIVALCNRCLSKDPTQRPSARDAAALLAQGAGMRVVDDLPTPAVSGPATDHEPSVLIRGEPVDGLADAPTVAIPAEAGSAPVDVRASVVTAFAAGVSGARSGTGPTGFAAAGAGGPPGLAAAEPTGFAGAGGPPGLAATGPTGFAGAGGPPGFSGNGPALSGPGGGPAAPATPGRSRRYLWLAAVVVPVVAVAALLWMLRPEAPSREAAAVPPAAHESIVEAPGSPSRGTGTPDVLGAGAAGVTPPAPTTSNGNPAATPAQPDRPPAATPTTPAHPTGTTPTAGDPVPTSTAPRHEWTLTSVGGTVQATCPAPDTAQLLSWTATPPYRLKDVKAGPAPTANVVFRHGAHTVKMKITCSGGVPSTENIEN
jgi:serine/threonine-protein kinase